MAFLKGDRVMVNNHFDPSDQGVIIQTWQDHCFVCNMPEYQHLPKYFVKLQNGGTVSRYDTDLELISGDPEEIIMTTRTNYRFKGKIIGLRFAKNGVRWFDIVHEGGQVRIPRAGSVVNNVFLRRDFTRLKDKIT